MNWKNKNIEYSNKITEGIVGFWINDGGWGGGPLDLISLGIFLNPLFFLTNINNR